MARPGMSSTERQVDGRLFRRHSNDLLDRLDHPSAFEEYVCECGRRSCASPVTLSHEEYRWIRQRPGCFVVVPGHWLPNDEHVVTTHPRYQVIEKLDEADRTAARRSAGRLD